jgi:hypothetical protein
VSFHFQTTTSDIRAGWSYFEAWKRRFWLSRRRWNARDKAEDWLYLATWQEVRNLDLMDGDDFHDIDSAFDEKLAFLKAYLSLVAIDSHQFAAQARNLLKLQSRVWAKKAYGFWFWQSDMDEFGPGVSRFFQSWQCSIFCERPKQIDFASIMAVLPYDNVLVRHPTRKWRSSEAQHLVSAIRADLDHDGIDTDIDFSIDYNLLVLDVVSPEYGHDMTANRLRTIRASEAYDELLAPRLRHQTSTKTPPNTKTIRVKHRPRRRHRR